MNLPDNESLITDSQLWEALDLSAPGLSRVRAAYESGSLDLAQEELIHYFETRTNVSFLYDYRELPLTPIDTDECPYSFQSSLGLQGSLKERCLYTARQMINHIYVVPGTEGREIDLGLNWESMLHYRFPEDTKTHHRQPFNMIVRGQFFESLCILYHETGDPTVLKAFEEILEVYLKTYPLMIEDPLPDANRFQYTEDRDVMSVGWLAIVYLSLFYTRVPYEISTKSAFEILKHLFFLGIQFKRFDEDKYRPYNHHMWERGLVPFLLGTLLPEIPAFRTMKQKGAAIVSRHVSQDFNSSGGYNEHSIAYWSGAALGEMLYRGVYVARLNQEPLLDEDSSQKLKKTFELLGHLCPPGERFPSLGDNGGPLAGPMIRLAVRMFDLAWAKELTAIREQKLKEVAPPLPLDFADHRAGYLCSRSNYSQDGNYLVMSAKTCCGASGHNHMDMLSMFITFRGQEFIGEPYAGSLYHSVRMNSYERGYMYNMTSHNTVLAYGKPICPDEVYANKWGVYRPDSPIIESASTEKGFWARACHDGYTHCRHIRTLLFNRQRGFLLCDQVERGNRLPGSHIERWHLMKGVSCRILSKDTVLLEKNHVTLLATWVHAKELRLWKNLALCPHPFQSQEELFPILDVTFEAAPDRNSDNMTASLYMVMADVTGREDVNAYGEEFCEKSKTLVAQYQKAPKDANMIFHMLDAL